jgi:hypothetical protein
LQSTSAKFLGDFAISSLQHLAEFRPFGAAPTANIRQIKIIIAKLRAEEIIVWTHPQQPAQRTQPTRPFDVGSPATI